MNDNTKVALRCGTNSADIVFGSERGDLLHTLAQMIARYPLSDMRETSTLEKPGRKSGEHRTLYVVVKKSIRRPSSKFPQDEHRTNSKNISRPALRVKRKKPELCS